MLTFFSSSCTHRSGCLEKIDLSANFLKQAVGFLTFGSASTVVNFKGTVIIITVGNVNLPVVEIFSYLYCNISRYARMSPTLDRNLFHDYHFAHLLRTVKLDHSTT